MATEAPSFVYGLPGNDFYILHICAIISLSVSILTSSTILIYLLVVSNKTSLYQRPIGERLVVYLAFYDLAYSISHELDHSYMVAVLDNPPDEVCRAFAFFVQGFILAQSLLVLFTSVNAMVMVVLERKLRLGCRDWKLFAVTLGIPVAVGCAGLAVPFLGPTGSWCLVDMRPWYGALVNTVYGVVMCFVFVVNLICYGAIYIRIRRAAAKVATSNDSQRAKRHKAAKLMMIFIAVYLFQYLTYVMQALWSFAGPPPVELYIFTVVFINLGGVYNGIAYTIIKKKFSSSGEGNATATTTASASVSKY